MRRERAQAYEDQFDYLSDCFELVRKRGDAYNIRSEAMETERMVRYSERTGFESERSHLLEIYRDIESDVLRNEKDVACRKAAAAEAGIRFPIDQFVERHALTDDELGILLVLLYNESVGGPHARFTNGHQILNLLFPNPVSALKASRYLDAGATLLRKGLVRTTGEDPSNFLRASYEVTETTLHQVLGVRDGAAIREPMDSAHASAPPVEGPFRVVAPRVSLDQVVLPADIRQRLDELLWQVRLGDGLLREWGLDEVLEKGHGTIVLFGGPPGTGKTMTAEAMARSLELPLFVADYSRLESKWIGETEKNIVAVFREAASAGAVLLLDEADAILAGRLDGGHYNDRAYNRQVSLLLTELEAFEGLCILTTNREVTLDPGLARRIAARFDFPVPGPEERIRLWRRLLPAGVPLDESVDLNRLAERFALAGGHIRNVVLAAVRRAAWRDGRRARPTMEDFLEAASRERKSFEAETREAGFHQGTELGFS